MLSSSSGYGSTQNNRSRSSRSCANGGVVEFPSGVCRGLVNGVAASMAFALARVTPLHALMIASWDGPSRQECLQSIVRWQNHSPCRGSSDAHAVNIHVINICDRRRCIWRRACLPACLQSMRARDPLEIQVCRPWRPDSDSGTGNACVAA